MVAALVIAGLNDVGPSPARTTACATVRAGDTTLRVTSGGRRRSALLHVPRGANRPIPLILAFHGAGGDGSFMQSYSGLSRAADPRGMAVLYPTADRGRRRWTLQGDSSSYPDDVAFVRNLLVVVKRRLCVDARRVYATGISNGAGFAAFMTCRIGGLLAAIAPVAGAYRVDSCDAASPVSVLEIHGTADESAPYRGRAPIVEPVRTWLREWAVRDGCSATPVRRRIAIRTVRSDWPGCRRGIGVTHIEVYGGTHSWPGSTPPGDGPPSTISAADQIVRFFARRRLVDLPR